MFAGGDNVTGPATVVEAVATGREAAESIDRYLRGEEFEKKAEVEKKAKEETKPVPLEEVPLKGVEKIERAKMPEVPMKRRVKSFEEVEIGFTEEVAIEEAKRCLQCGGCSECMECVRACEAKAVTIDTHSRGEQSLTLDVGAIIIATGLDFYDVSKLEEYGYGRIKNVITAIEYERLTAASGPTFGALKRPSDGKISHNIAFIQCVGSRDFKHMPYCSTVCCMHATKEAMMAYEHEPGGTKSTIFYMDMRAVGKRFQEYLTRAKEEYNVTYVRSRPGKIDVNPQNQNPIIWYMDTTTRETKSFEAELVVLSQAMIPRITRELAEILGTELDENGFVKIPSRLSQPVDTTRPGIFACGYVQRPQDIPDSVSQASGAAARAAEAISGH
jgi:heterodisulfide reductase subunit A-like polyferredoxin